MAFPLAVQDKTKLVNRETVSQPVALLYHIISYPVVRRADRIGSAPIPRDSTIKKRNKRNSMKNVETRRAFAIASLVAPVFAAGAADGQEQPSAGQQPPSPEQQQPSPGESISLDLDVLAKQLDIARSNIQASLGATVYEFGRQAIESQPQGENQSFNRLLLQAPGVTQDS
ncbi:MAG: hypothetical protein J2P48_17095, partial [Alphaproteobacteria bacterium]|nr:hypothetical protein [Alphaproteobacteria bacterium]